MSKPDPRPTLDYEPPEPPPWVPPMAILVLLGLPMIGLGALSVPMLTRGLLPPVSLRTFWYLRAIAMACALISIVLLSGSRGPLKRLPPIARIAYAIDLIGLALCTFGVLRYVVIHMPPPNG